LKENKATPRNTRELIHSYVSLLQFIILGMNVK